MKTHKTGIPFTLTKLNRPSLPEDHVSRARLLEWLESRRSLVRLRWWIEEKLNFQHSTLNFQRRTKRNGVLNRDSERI
jgi:hypothetical protein